MLNIKIKMHIAKELLNDFFNTCETDVELLYYNPLTYEYHLRMSNEIHVYNRNEMLELFDIPEDIYNL